MQIHLDDNPVPGQTTGRYLLDYDEGYHPIIIAELASGQRVVGQARCRDAAAERLGGSDGELLAQVDCHDVVQPRRQATVGDNKCGTGNLAGATA